MLKAWTAREPFAWNGKHWQYMMVNVWPRLFQLPHPPVERDGDRESEHKSVSPCNAISDSITSSSAATPRAPNACLTTCGGSRTNWGSTTIRSGANVGQYVLVADTDVEAERPKPSTWLAVERAVSVTSRRTASPCPVAVRPAGPSRIARQWTDRPRSCGSTAQLRSSACRIRSHGGRQHGDGP